MERKDKMKIYIKKFFINLKEFLIIRKAEIIEELIKENNYKSYVEIGVWKGETTKYLLEHCNLDKVICVDNYITNNELYDTKIIEKAKEQALLLTKIPKVFFYDLSSKEAAKHVKDNSIDIIYIDADHTYESVKQDIEAWYPKVREGGILCGHDYNIKWMGVIKAVSERFYPIRLKSDNVWWVKK